MKRLLDINVWLALAFQSHEHHEIAARWFTEMGAGSCGMCRMTQQGFLRLATNKKIFKRDASTLEEAWDLYDAILADERVFFEHEPLEIEAPWRNFTARDTHSTKVWNDAYLAAFAKQASFQMVTFDTGFTQYPGLDLELLR